MPEQQEPGPTSTTASQKFTFSGPSAHLPPASAHPVRQARGVSADCRQPWPHRADPVPWQLSGRILLFKHLSKSQAESYDGFEITSL